MRSISAREIVQVWEWGRNRHLVDRALFLLAVAQPELTPDQIAALTVGQRNARLLTLREKTLGPTLQGLAHCAQCGTPVEFAVDVAAIRYPEPTVHESTLNVNGFYVRFRLPDSRDLAAIIGCDQTTAARQLLIEHCVLHAEQGDQEIAAALLPEAVIAPLAAAVVEQDPQSEMHFQLTCPLCQHTWSALFDIVSFFWAEITALAKRLLQDVHVLARAYGWREADILAMSTMRRQFYLELQGDG